MNAVMAIIRNVLRTSLRERSALIFTLLLPVFVMYLFGTIFGGSGPKLPVGIVDRDHSSASAALIKTLKAQQGLTIEVGSLKHELNRLHGDSIDMVAVIPAGLGKLIATHTSTPAVIHSYLDRNQVQQAVLAESAVSQIINAYAEKISASASRRSGGKQGKYHERDGAGLLPALDGGVHRPDRRDSGSGHLAGGSERA